MGGRQTASERANRAAPEELDGVVDGNDTVR